MTVTSIVLIILAVGVLLCTAIVIVMCFRGGQKTIILEGEDKPIDGDVVYVKSPRRNTRKDLDELTN